MGGPEANREVVLSLRKMDRCAFLRRCNVLDNVASNLASLSYFVVRLSKGQRVKLELNLELVLMQSIFVGMKIARKIYFSLQQILFHAIVFLLDFFF